MEAGAVEDYKENVHSTVSTTLLAMQFYQHDPLLVLLKEKLHFRNLWISIGMMLPPGIVYLAWWLLLRTELPTTWNNKDFFSVIIQIFLLFPLLFLIYTSIPTFIADLFNTLLTNGVIGTYRNDRSGKETHASFQKQLIYWIDNSWWTVAIMLVVILYVLFRLLVRELPDQHNLISYPVRATVIIMYAPLMFATGMSVIRLVLALIFMNRLLYFFTLQIKPLHADGSGGLGILEHILWLCVGMMLWVVILLAAAVLAHNLSGLSLLEMFLLGAIYIALIPALLIGWFIIPHRMMVKARAEALQPLAVTYQQALMQSLSSGIQDTQSMTDETLRLETLKKHYDLAYTSFPVWPLETSTLSSAGITILLPVILPLLLPPIVSLILLALQRLGF
ncbi:hypothetical protein ccbrp13_19890 [Ktedonobacteria bacterium brp13]|nr:hypothetical protein ccbrp13_19890 [Ktedonobacteria bacterium brp13]